MKRFIISVALAALAVLSSSCDKSMMEKMQLAENVDIQCTPELLGIVGGQIPATVTVTCPKGYFHPKATMDVTPVLVYDGGEIPFKTLQYQGDKVKDNFKVVSNAGATITEKLNFKYQPGCEKARLELRGTIHFKDKDYPVGPVKVADGCIADYQLADLQGLYEVKPDGYQAVLQRTTEGRILYDVGSDKVRQDQFETNSMVNYKNSLDYLKEDERTTIKGTQIVAYASPEGGQEFNAKLSDKRADTAQKALDKVAKDIELTGTEIKSVGQDWEGFREAVSKSNIEDKDLILRVLSMYSDPAVRESEIRNLSQIYSEINKRVFPELRRARLVTSTEFRNWSDDELVERAQKGLDRFDEPSVLRLAAIAETPESKESLYKYAINQFNSDTARYNLAMLYLDQGKTSLGGAYLSKIKEPDAEVLNATGVVAMRNQDYELAAKCFEKAGDISRENATVMNIMKGDYKAAAECAKGLKGDNAALANLLAGDTAAAEAALEGDAPRTDYIRAIIAARKGKTGEAKKLLEAACSKDEALKARAEKDIEFAALAN
jgi:outer membrane protein OmpA-like peptidoglycan-associated protein